MPRILAIETSSTLCSVALGDGVRVEERGVTRPREHHALVLPMVAELLDRAGLKPRQLDAIAFGQGPGSFTGLRIAASIAQGLAFGGGLPVIAVSSLQALALDARELADRHRCNTLLAAVDAHMGEIYVGVYECAAGGVRSRGAEQVCRVDGFDLHALCDAEHTLLVGDAWSTYPRILPGGVHFTHDALPHARHVLHLAAALDRDCWRDAAQAVPLYLRDASVWNKVEAQARR